MSHATPPRPTRMPPLAGGIPLDPRPAPRPTAAASGGNAAPAVVEVTEATFATEVIERSRSVPVVIDFWADWCGPCRQLSPVLERLAQQAAGQWVLAKIDVDANPRIAQAAQVQGIPAVKGVVNGQLVAEFTGALPEAQVRAWLTDLLTRAGSAPADGGPPPLHPDVLRGDDALAVGDLAGARAAYEGRLKEAPGDRDAETGLARVGLVERLGAIDERAVRARLAADPADVDAAAAVADLEVLADRADVGFAALVEAVRRTNGAERDRARAHLLGLFDAVGDDEPRVAQARRALAAALF